MKSYPYPPDEFDAATHSAGPRGVHRRRRSRWSRWWPFVVVLLVFPALAYVGVTWLSDWEGLPGIGQGEIADETDAPTEDPADAAVETPGQTPEETPAPDPDLTRPVEVLNATTTAGLAGDGADRLGAAGFTSVDTGNWAGAAPTASVVYFGTPEDVSTAQLAAQTLGIATIEESPERAPAGIVVVLADDYVAS